MSKIRSHALLVGITLLVMIGTTPASAPLADRPDDPFPGAALQPKKETGVDRFLKEHPRYDGRGVVVAIFDSGVDPGAPGLQITSDGKPKIVDMVDASGSGDVVTSTVRQVEDGKLAGLSGRELTPHDDWRNPSGDYHLGLKPAFELFPRGLVNRLREERGDDWDEVQRPAVAAARRELVAWDEANAEPTREQLERREELAARLEQLEGMQEAYEDPGPVYDCVVFHDGDRWRAAIDTNENGDFNDETTLTNYRDEKTYATFGDRDLLNYALNVYEDGNLLSVVADAGAHGTHVAGMVAANFPDNPDLNGAAPGAQLVVVKIGDTRLGSSSCGTGDVRGFVAVLQNQADMINMSYGGPTPIPDHGRLEELRSEIINEHGVIWCGSAGNSGPGLSTVGGPGGTTSATYGIGAMISPEMMTAQYSLRESRPELPYTWTSRGPTTDGALGVDFCAPGAAISPVPNWNLQGTNLFNGTSMSSPNTCGGIALILSGLKDRDVPWTPQSVRRALKNTARFVEGHDPWGQGAGIVQIDKAFEHLVAHAERPDRDVRYEFSVAAQRGGRGIYLREPFDNDRKFMSRVTVDPVFPEEADNRDKVAFEQRVLLQPTESWVQAPASVLLLHNGRGFEVGVDPTGLPPGAHYAEIHGIDADHPDYGPLFRLPVTVVRTRDVTAADGWTHRETLPLAMGQIERRFFAVPKGATWADVAIRRTDRDTSRLLVVQTVQLVEGDHFADYYNEWYLRFGKNDEQIRSLPVVGGRTLEVDFAQYWRSLGESVFEVEVRFHGLVPSSGEIAFAGGDVAAALDVTAPFRGETIAPSGRLTTLRRTLRPTDSEIRPLLAERDRLPKERQIHELVATYEFTIEEEGEYGIRPAVSDLQHTEESYQSHIWMVLDANGRRVGVGVGTNDGGSVELGPGDYRLLLHLRHDDPAALELVRNMALRLDRELDKPLKLGFHRDGAGAVENERSYRARHLLPGETARLHVRLPADEKLPDDAREGDVLLGSVTFGEEHADLVGPGRRPGGYPVTVTVPPEPAEDEDVPEASDAEAPDERSELAKLAEDVRDLQVERLESLTGEENEEAFAELSAELLAAWPDHLPLRVALLKHADPDEGEGEAAPVVAAADEILARVDREALAAHFGVEHDADEPVAEKLHQEKKKERKALREALFRKARALYHRAAADDDEEAHEAFATAFAELEQWADLADEKYFELRVGRETLRERPAIALGLVNERLEDEDEPKRELFERRLGLLEELGWEHWAEYERRWVLVRFPVGDPVF